MNIEINQIYNMDCLEGMKHIPDNSIDMILCDLPYGTTQNKWDSCISLDEIWSQYNRICKLNAAVCLFAQTPFDKILGVSNISNLRYEWIWIKENGTGFLNSKRCPLKIHENILVFYKQLPVYNPQMTNEIPYKVIKKHTLGRQSSNYGKYSKTDTFNTGSRYPISSIYFPRDKDKIHPTQKPVALCEYLIKTYTNEGMTILDNCMGSGTTAIACQNTKRNYIGFEINKEYYDASIVRIKENNNSLISIFS